MKAMEHFIPALPVNYAVEGGATISDGIIWNRNLLTPPQKKINVEVARREKRAILHP